MAKKTNKTDHVLNLLSSGKKNSKEENDAPPVDLRRKAPEPESDDPFETHLPEPKMTTQEEEPELPEPRMSSQEEDSQLPEPHVSESVPTEERPAVVTVAAGAPSVSVVHASNGEDSIAEAVKDSLEAEFNEYLKEKEELEGKLDEKLEEIAAQQEQVIEWQPLKPKEPAEINVFELLGRDEETEESEQESRIEAESVSEPDAEVSQVGEVVAEPEPLREEAIEPPEPTLEPVSAMEPEIAEPDIEAIAVAEPEAEVPRVDEAVAEPEPIEEASPVEEAPVQQKEEPMEQPKTEEKDYVMVNVMEHLVRDQAPKYIRQFGHCDCDRCIEDTVALTLTHLPSKYVVVNKNAVSPLLNFYEKKYAGQLIVEITKATMIVNESPHH